MEETDVRTYPIDDTRMGERVAQVLGNGPVTIKKWGLQAIHGGLEQSAVVRWQGEALCSGETRAWSMVIKKIPPDGQQNPAGFRYGKREVLAYQSGFFARLPESLSAPRCFDVEERPDRSVWLWLEDVADDYGGSWTLEAYRRAAYQLGLFNGAYLAGAPIPEEEWISRGWLRGYVENAAPMVDFIRRNPAHPLVKSLYGGNLAFILALWEVRHDLLGLLEQMPQTFCHQDAFKRNLFFQKGRLLAIDWSYAGIAPPGTDLVPLVAVSLGFGSIPTRKITELDRICFDAYLVGLTEAGAPVSAREVRRCFTLTLLLRYLIGANIGEVLPALLDQNKRGWIEQGFNQSVEETSKTDPNLVRFYFSIFLESLRLMGIKPLLKILYYTVMFRLNPRRRGREG